MLTTARRTRIEAMWVVYLMLALAALYAVIIPDLASFSDHGGLSGAGSAFRIDPASRGADG
jgi:hypothetical protein